MENANVKYIAVAPDGKEVEELTSKEILMNLRKKVPAKDFFSNFSTIQKKERNDSETSIEKIELTDELKSELKNISKNLNGTDKAVLLNRELEELKKVSSRAVSGSLKRV